MEYKFKKRLKEVSQGYLQKSKTPLGDYEWALTQENIFNAFKKNEVLSSRTKNFDIEKMLLIISNGVAYDQCELLTLEGYPLHHQAFYAFLVSNKEENLGEFSFYINWYNNITKGLQIRPEFSPISDLKHRSLYPLEIDFEGVSPEYAGSECPLIFTEPYMIDWPTFFSKVKKGVFCFPNTYQFFNYFYHDSFLEILQNRAFGFLVCGDPYFYSPPEGGYIEKFVPLDLSLRGWWKGVDLQATNLKLLCQELSLMFLEGEEFFEEYSVFLGKRWHSGGNTLQGILEKKMDTLKPKKKIAHVLGRLCDTFSLTKRVVEIVKEYKDEEVIVITTEFQSYLNRARPYQVNRELTSLELAPNVLEELSLLEVGVFLGNPQLDLTSQASNVTQILKEEGVDVVIFHDLLVVNFLIAKNCKGKVRLFMEHGDLPEVKGVFDGVILSHPNEVTIYKDLSSSLGIPFFSNENVLDVEEKWLSKIWTKSDLGLPEDAVLLCTVSNSLDERITDVMLLAVLSILERCPKAFYILIGTQKDHTRFFHERIVCLGNSDKVPHLLRSMDIYLNEFPNGSGLAILEAMASGSPIVTMYDKGGELRSRHGGNYFGIERAITSCCVKEYIDLACRLIEDREFYFEWSRHARKQYEKRSNIKLYFNKHREIIHSYFS